MRAFLAMLLISAGVQAADTPVTVTLSGLTAKVPDGWKSEKPDNLLRSYQFKLATPDKDHADAEVIVMPESSKDVAKNFNKWTGQYTPPDDKKTEVVSTATTFEQAGATFHTLDVSGTWKYRERPNDAKTEKILPEFRTIWVMVIASGETTHLRFSGHVSAVEKHEKDFAAFLKALQAK